MEEYAPILYTPLLRWDHQTLSYSIAPDVAAWRPFIEQALTQWDQASGLSFVRTGGDADIHFTTLTAVSAPIGTVGWTVLWTDDNTGAISNGFVGLPTDPTATDPFLTALHETGHVIGLSHPGQTFSSDATHQDETVMAYPDKVYGSAATLRAWDIAAAQSLYGPDDLVLGGAAPDSLAGGDGRDSLDGGSADDRLSGAGDADTLRGGAGSDVAYGNLGDDLVYGNTSSDNLFGGQGADSLFGGQGDDFLAGGLHDDVLTGGAGADRFVIQASGGTDRITDFNPAEGDRLQHVSVMEWTVSDGDSGTLLTFGDGSMVNLQGVHGVEATADWFAIA